ncbi:Signal transduction histidine kinase [Cyclonatronum proteinivorum]|uniref:histidine kinase n=1 Tax=Cyclonatronum proteinivorum TaxID=1457365 RepID=A0A345UPW6_9BACT|nr:tetratricopeptide repeat-containing sensor histidine kinase [Cyclonatronum proteinivorum]AXJ02518.1 Signal transduction histidine kinase [Cyclonatronum proteinivorum]
MKLSDCRVTLTYWVAATCLLCILAACSSERNTNDHPDTAEAQVIAQLNSILTAFLDANDEAFQSTAFDLVREIREGHSGNEVIAAYSYLTEGFLNQELSRFPLVYENMNQAYELGMALQVRDVVIRAAAPLINAAFVISRETESEQIAEEVTALAAQPPHDPYLIHLALLSNGFHHFISEDFTAALPPLMQAADFFEKNGDTRLWLKTNNSIAMSLQRVGRPQEALERFEQNLAAYYASGNRIAVSRTLNNLSISLSYMGEKQKAIDSLKVALEINEQAGLEFNALQVQYNIGAYLRVLQQYDESEYYLRESLDRSKRMNLSMGVLYNSLGLARTLIWRDSTQVNIPEVRSLMRQTADSAPNLAGTDLYMDYSEAMFRLEQISGNFEEALRWHIIYQQQYSRITSTERQVAIEELMFANRLERSEAEIAHLSEVIKLKERAQRNLFAGLGVLGLLLLGAGGAGYYFRQLSSRISALYNVQKLQNAEIAKQNEELKRLTEERFRLTKVIIHDLRNPIGAIDATLEMLEDYPNEELDQFKMFMQVSVEKMSHIVNGLLKVYQAESLEIGDKLRETDIKPLLDLQVQEFSILAAHKQQKLIAEIEPLRAVSHADTLNTIVSNLLSNAIKYTPHGKSVLLRAQPAPGGWQLTVRDQGPGFREADKEKMFTLFGRLSGRPTGDEESTGIGLYAVKTAADKLGATLTVNWDYKDGAELSCFFPLLETTALNPKQQPNELTTET